jgi:hypothetical protein
VAIIRCALAVSAAALLDVMSKAMPTPALTNTQIGKKIVAGVG